jgi:cyclopropane-fatty-acyl-phospholipid synthase
MKCFPVFLAFLMPSISWLILNFQGFLSKDMTYSCAIFDVLDGDLEDSADRGEWSGGQGLKRLGHPPLSTHSPSHTEGQDIRDELYEAQIRKLNHIIKKAKILPGHRVLEIGSGWGSMSILIARTIPGTTVDTITLSVQQQSLTRQRVADVGLEKKITVHLMDYRDMPADWEGVFDRVVSIEMIEAVGAEFLEKYWNVVDWAMKKKGGIGVVQVITIPEPSKQHYRSRSCSFADYPRV